MIDSTHEALIQDVLAGEATTAQQAELDRLVALDPAIRARHAEMREVFRVLADSPTAEPPASLRPNIMREVSHASARTATARPRWRLFPVLATGAAIAATLIVVSIVRGPSAGGPAGAPVSGTLAPVRDVAQGNIVSRATLALEGGAISLVSARDGDRIRVVLRSRLAQPADLEVRFAPELLTLVSTRQSLTHGTAVAEPGRVRIDGIAAGEIMLVFTARGSADAPVVVRGKSGAEALLHTTPQP